jgi:hypothetical protein
MSGETERSESAWTVDTLRIHLEALIASVDARHAARMDANEANRAYLLGSIQAADGRQAAQYNSVEGMISREVEGLKALMNARMDAAEQAVKIEQANAAQWRASANEWRSAMDDRERKFMPRIESEQRLTDLIARVDKVESRVDSREGRSVGGQARTVDQRATVAAIVGVSTFLLAIIVVIANFLAAS